MAGDITRLEAEFAQAFAAEHAALRRYLQQAFPRLADQADDILHDASLETLRRIRGEAFCPAAGWAAWLRIAARSRAIDRLRSWEFRLFRKLAGGADSDCSSPSSRSGAGGPDPAAPGPGPRTRMIEAERRGRQGVLLSQVLAEFCRWCEARPERLQAKEAYERSLRGQAPAEIAAAMDLSADRIYGLLNRARQWVFQRIGHEDVDRSVFLTLYRRKPD